MKHLLIKFKNLLRGLDKSPRRAGFGPRAALCPLLPYGILVQFQHKIDYKLIFFLIFKCFNKSNRENRQGNLVFSTDWFDAFHQCVNVRRNNLSALQTRSRKEKAQSSIAIKSKR